MDTIIYIYRHIHIFLSGISIKGDDESNSSFIVNTMTNESNLCSGCVPCWIGAKLQAKSETDGISLLTLQYPISFKTCRAFTHRSTS